MLHEAGFEVREHTSGARLRRQEMMAALREADTVLAGVKSYDTELLAAIPRLRCISRCGIGKNSIALSATQRLGVSVLTTVDEIVEPVAQMTIAMILALARHFPEHGRDFQAGVWKKHTGHLLSEWTVGLVGFGRIGRMVEGYLRVFGPRVLVADPNLQADRIPPGVERVDLATLLARADLVSLHAARPAHESVLLGRREISAMKAGSRLVNTERGYLIDESGLVEALQSGHLAGAALDVFDRRLRHRAVSGAPGRVPSGLVHATCSDVDQGVTGRDGASLCLERGRMVPGEKPCIQCCERKTGDDACLVIP
ncbi:MAG: hypothetical protein HY207_08910 [Nitrospirae bacterium]|nr:hypothetical protein [Nitrospirota bacterium]